MMMLMMIVMVAVVLLVVMTMVVVVVMVMMGDDADGADDVCAIPKNGSHGRKADKLGRDKAHSHIRCNHSHRMAGNNHHWPGNRPASIKASPRKTVKPAGASDTPFDPSGIKGMSPWLRVHHWAESGHFQDGRLISGAVPPRIAA